MRQLLDKEKNIIKALVSARATNHYEYMQFAYILRSNVQYDYLKWEVTEEQSCIETVLKDGTDDEKSEVFYKIIDLIGFFEELERRCFVKFVFRKKQNDSYPRYHYNKEKYVLVKQVDFVWYKPRTKGTKLIPIAQNEGDMLYIYYGDIVSVIERFLDCTIYPLESLIDYSKDFKTVEQRRHNKNIKLNKISIGVAIIIGIISPIFTKCISDDKCQNIQTLILSTAQDNLPPVDRDSIITLNVKPK